MLSTEQPDEKKAADIMYILERKEQLCAACMQAVAVTVFIYRREAVTMCCLCMSAGGSSNCVCVCTCM